MIVVSKVNPLIYHFKNIEATNTIFLDRDGVLNKIVHRGDVISSPRVENEIHLDPHLSIFRDPIFENWNLVMVSNQPDLSRGEININFIERINILLRDKFDLTAAYICKHQHFEGCFCRKPKPGLLNKFWSNNPNVNGKSIFVGDQSSDLEFARNAGIKFILKKNYYNCKLQDQSKIMINELTELKEIIN